MYIYICLYISHRVIVRFGVKDRAQGALTGCRGTEAFLEYNNYFNDVILI